MKMKVSHIVLSLGYGGIETMVVNIANEQAYLGAEVIVIIINDLVSQELYNRFSPDVKVVQIGRKLGSKSFSFIKRLGSELDCLKPNVFHLHGSAMYDFLPRRWRNGVVCSTLHAIPYGVCGVSWHLGRFIQRYVLHQEGNVMNINRVSCVFAISNSVSSALKEKYGVDSYVICNGINSSTFSKRVPVMPSKGLKIVSVGRLEHEKKGQDLLIDAIVQLIKDNRDCSLDMIGEGPSRPFLESLIRKQGLQGRIRLLGSKSQNYIASHLCDYDIFVQPSRYEGFGLTVAEAMASQVPVIVSSGQGPEEVTSGQTYGWVFHSGNSKDLAQIIACAFDNYKVFLDKVIPARLHVETCYDVRVTANKYLDAYSNLNKN